MLRLRDQLDLDVNFSSLLLLPCGCSPAAAESLRGADGFLLDCKGGSAGRGGVLAASLIAIALLCLLIPGGVHSIRKVSIVTFMALFGCVCAEKQPWLAGGVWPVGPELLSI